MKKNYINLKKVKKYVVYVVELPNIKYCSNIY